MSQDPVEIYQAQLQALATVREACTRKAPEASAEELNHLAQALKVVVEVENEVAQKLQPIKSKNPFAS
jgi:archaellum component FlaC